jgi:hypothetical protein
MGSESIVIVEVSATGLIRAPDCRGASRRARLTPMTTSDQAELSTLRTQVEDLITRVMAVADRYSNTPDSAVAADLFAAERSLITTRRALDRATAHLAEMP